MKKIYITLLAIAAIGASQVVLAQELPQKLTIYENSDSTQCKKDKERYNRAYDSCKSEKTNPKACIKGLTIPQSCGI
jgi:hypothetical protein